VIGSSTGSHDGVNRVLEWYLVDLHVLRLHWEDDRHMLKYEIKPNGDGTHFIAFWIDSFPWFPGILVAEHLYTERKNETVKGLPSEGCRGLARLA
jgi:hypothetical protein